MIGCIARLVNVTMQQVSLDVAFEFMVIILVVFINITACALQIMIIDYRLTYPSGTATGILINSFHTPGGVETAKYVSYPLILFPVAYLIRLHFVGAGR